MVKKTYYLHSYGCQMNLADSGMLSAAMEAAGYAAVPDPALAGVIILNTCSVREKAEERALGRLRELTHLKRKGGVSLCAIGCMAQRMGARLIDEIPEIDFVLGTQQLFQLPSLLEHKNGAPMVETAMGEYPAGSEYPPAPDNPYSAHVVITRGCNNFCAYCIVPYLRGPEHHRPPHLIVRDINHLATRGVSEITLVGQNVNSYRHGDLDFAGLIRMVMAETDLPRVRFITSHPKDLSDSLVALFGDEPRLMGHLHLPLQSGADRILGLMRRGYTLAHYRDRVGQLRRMRPDIALTTDLIVGFPSESEAEFQATLTAVRETAFDAAFMFRYSVREGTWAAENLADSVPEEIKLRRLTELIALQKEVSRAVNQREVGRIRVVLVDGTSRRDKTIWKGKTEGNKTILVPGGGDNLLGRIVPVRVIRADSWTLHGELAL